MQAAVQRYEVSQIFAECQAKGLPLRMACMATLLWFDQQRITPPASLLDWFAEVPQDQWRPDRVH